MHGDPMTEQITLPEGTVVLESAQPRNGVPDLELARDVARLGASPMLVRALGGEQAVRDTEAIAGNRDRSE